MEETQVKHFKFRQMRRITTGLRLPNGITGKYSLLCCANTYGMMFIGGNNSFAVCHTAILYKVNDEDTDDRNEAVPLETLKPVMVSLPGQPCHISLSADELTLSVCLRESSVPCMLYDTRSFCEPCTQSPKPFAVINLTDATGGVWVSGLSWNPGQPECFAVCLSNGCISVWENQGTSVKCSANLSCDAASICWSPKGKQLAVGHRDGRVSQYSPQMELKKEYPAPEALTEKHQVAGLFWISTHQFALVLTPSDTPPSDNDGLPPPSHFMILTASKKKAPEFEDFDDIYYGMGNNEPNFLFSSLSTWNIMITCSSSASESMVLSKRPDSEVAWEKWNLEDDGRAELPVDGTDDTFPCGMCLDLTSTVPIPYGESSEIPPSPLFVLLSDHGLLIPYMVFNIEPPPGTSYDFIKPPQALNKTGERLASSPSSVPKSILVTTGSHQVTQSINTTTTATLPLASKILSSEMSAPSSTFIRSFSLDKKPLSLSLPPFSGGGSLPNLLATSNTLPMAFSKPQSVVTPLSQSVQKAPLTSGNDSSLPPFSVAVSTSVTAKTPPAPFKQPLLSSTPISTAPQNIVGSTVSSATMTTMPPPSSAMVSNIQAPSLPKAIPTTSTMPATSAMPAPVQKLVSSHAPPTRPSAPSPTFSVTSSVEEENVEKGLITSIEQEIEEFSEQLQEHFDDVQDTFCSDLDDPDDGLCAIGGEEDKKKLVDGQDEMATAVKSFLDQTKDLARMVEGMMDEVLECRSLYEEANDAIRMRNSDHYREYVRKKPLTPLLQNLLDEVHTQYAIAEARVRELSAQIDADVERRKELEVIRVGGAQPAIHTPSYHNIYTTLKNNRRITRLQSTSVDQLVEKMKKMTVLPRAWNFSTSSPTTSSSSTLPDKPTRQSQVLLNEVKSVMSPVKQVKKKKQPLFKYSPERLSQLRDLFEASVHSTSMQTIPLITSFTRRSSTQSTRSTTPILDEEDDEVTLNAAQVEPHTPPDFSLNYPGRQQLLQGNYPTVSQPLQGVPFMTQPMRLLQSVDQEAPQLSGLHSLTSPPYGLPPINQMPLEMPQGDSKPQPKVVPTGQAFPPQSYVTSVPPPPPPSQPPSQDHVVHHGATVSSAPAVTTKTPSEMAAEAALKRQQSACGAATVTVQNTVVTTTVTKTPVVVITASEMPSSSLFFTGKSSQAPNQPSTNEKTTATIMHQFGLPMLGHSNSIPSNFQFSFSPQNPSFQMPPFFASTTGSQTSLAFTSSDNIASLSSLLSKSETSFPKPAGSMAPPESSLSSKSEVSFFTSTVTTSGTKPSNLLNSWNSTAPSGPTSRDTLTKPFTTQGESGEASGEETEQSDDGQDDTLTESPTGNDSVTATPILSLNAKATVSSTLPTLSTSVDSTTAPVISTTIVGPSVTFSVAASVVTVTSSVAPPTLIATTTAPPTNVILSSIPVSAAPPTLIATTTAPPTTNVILSSTPVSAAPPTSIATTTAPPTTSVILSTATLSSTTVSAALPTLIPTTTIPPTTSVISSTATLSSTTVSAAPPTLIADSLPTTSTIKSEVSSIATSSATATPTAESAAPPITESRAPPISESTAPPITESKAPPITESTATPSSTSTLPTTTSANVTSTISVVPPTPLTTAPPTVASSLSVKTTEATTDTVSKAPTLAVPLLRVADKPSDSEGESDVIDNGLDRVASQSSLASNMTDDINIVDDSEGEMDKEPAAKETTISQGFTSLFGERKTATNSMASSNPFGSLGNVSDNSSSISTGLHSANTPSVGSGGGFLAPSKFGQSSGLATGIDTGQTGGWGSGQAGMGVGQTGMGVVQTGMGIGQTGLGVGSNTSAFGTKFGGSPFFASGAQFGSRPLMGSMMGSTATTRVFGSSMESDQATTFGSIAAAGGGQTFGGIAVNQGMGTGTGIGVPKSSFQGWR